ncbi:hypothetical protein [Bdellovibrio sp. HCB209]|uniref:hypothetical protein n=1 Tax=Bdellovibrio sp. HCB209 TaxID=3394354 RepID=UPI0039B5807E
MKKEILLPIAVMSFLIGCSFSKESNQTGKNNYSPMNLEEKIASADVDSLKIQLNNLNDHDLESLTSNPKFYLNVAATRGSYDVLNMLIQKGLSPFKPDLKGESYYNQPSINDIHKSSVANLFQDSTQQANNLINLDDWLSLKNKTRNFELACDAVLGRIEKSAAYDDKIEEFINDVPNCMSSLRPVNLKSIMSKYFKEYVESNFQNDTLLVALFRVLPQESRLVRVQSSHGRSFHINPILILQELEPLEKNRISVTMKTLQAFVNSNDISAVIQWTPSPDQYESEVVARFGKEDVSRNTAAEIRLGIRKVYSKICSDIKVPKDLSEDRCTEFNNLDPEKTAEDQEIES